MSPAFDPIQFNILMELKEEGDDGMLKEIVAQFLSDCAGLLQTLGEAVEANDLTLVAQAAHSMKGGTATLGFTRATTLALEMETAARFGQSKGLDSMRELLEEAFTQGREELKRYAVCL